MRLLTVTVATAFFAPNLACIVASAGPYLPGKLAQQLGSESVRNLGCLDVGFVLSRREGKRLLDVHVGNHCKESHPIDLRRLRFYTAGSGGRPAPVTLHDPRREIDQLYVAACTGGHDAIWLNVAEGAELGPQVCIDVAHIAPNAPDARSLPVCLALGDGS